MMSRQSYLCSSCHGHPVDTWFRECELCEGTGKIPVEWRRLLRRQRVIRAMVKLGVLLILIYVALCAFVYFAKRL